LIAYVDHVEGLCKASVTANQTACVHLGKDAQERLLRLERAKHLLKEITGDEQDTRWKRGLLNFIGELSKILFGTMDEDDEKYYNEQINLFEQNSADMTTLLKQQLNVMKFSLGAANNTLMDIAFNEQSVKEGMAKNKDYLQNLEKESGKRFDAFDAKVETEG